MDLLQFHKMRTAVQVNAFPGSADDLAMMAAALGHQLESTDLFDRVEVEQTEDTDQLVIALCSFPPDVAEADVAAEVVRVWCERVAYPYWESHSVLVDNGHVEFEGATRPNNYGHYVTVHLVAQAPRIPVQRAPQASEERRATGV